ncbi:MAG TPA: AI-2E family transporter [Verrucomicrobiae bacterium]|jgi:predicted PurR-regulated permease PerM|nr:AI-2E family transporter [Verrucomicrobiae bacterium]
MSFPTPTARQAHLFWAALSALAVGVIGGLLFLLIWGLGHALDVLSPVLWPLAVAGVIAYLLDPVVDYFERKGLSRSRAIVSVFALALVIVLGVLANIAPPIVHQTREFAANAPKIIKKTEDAVEKWAENPPTWAQKWLKSESTPTETPASEGSVTNEPSSLSDTNAPATTATANHPGLSGTALGEKALDSITQWLKDLLPRAGSWVAASFALIAGLALVPIYAFYLLLEKRGIQSKWTNYLPLKDSTFKDELVFILQSINDYMIAFFRGQVLVAICDGILYGIGFLLIGLPYAILLGAAAIVLTIVPFIGAIIIFVVAMIIALVQFGDWKHPLLVLLVFGIVQTLEGVVISPRIMRGRVGLHPLTIIVAVMAGTTLLGGLLGGVLAIPLTAVLRVLMARYVWKRPLPKETS